jgi:signal transduction histidine kinase
MTTRITLAILLTTWVILIVGQGAAFLTARTQLLRLWDDTIATRAARLAEIRAGSRDPDAPVNVPEGDRFEVRNEVNAVVESGVGTSQQPRITIVDAGFDTSDRGKRVRKVTVKVFIDRDGRRVPYVAIYSRTADPFDQVLSRLAWTLLLISLSCGLTTAWLALKMSRAALRPLQKTGDVIAEIDEQSLERRIDIDAMPVELVPMTRRLNEMLDRLQSGFQQRKRFLADAAHELRTPTAALLTTLEVALRRPREQAVLIETMKSGLQDARRLRKLVEQLMEHARSEHLRGPDSMQEADVPAMLRECVQIVAPLAREKNVAITEELPAELPFVTQRERMRSIVLNLLSNAIEYNREGGTIRLAAERENGTLRLTVSDTGQGIAPAQLPQVFEPFYRGGNGRGDDPEHLGLGLFLVRSHVDALHGKCEIDSTVGVGTTLKITLPEPKRGSGAPATSASAATGAGAGAGTGASAGTAGSTA